MNLIDHSNESSMWYITGELYDPEEKVCCGSVLHTRPTTPHVCCGGVIHLDSTPPTLGIQHTQSHFITLFRIATIAKYACMICTFTITLIVITLFTLSKRARPLFFHNFKIKTNYEKYNVFKVVVVEWRCTIEQPRFVVNTMVHSA